jgi:NADH-quinone oxidoreductase subunit E
MTAHEIQEFLAPIRHEFADPRSLILPALRFAQEEQGWLPAEAMAAVAEATGFSQAYVESVATFYDRFYIEPVGSRVISVCTTLSCMLRGSDELLAHIGDRLGTGGEGTTDDRQFTVQRAECLGACDRAPCLQIDSGEQLGPLTHDDIDALLDELRTRDVPSRYDR